MARPRPKPDNTAACGAFRRIRQVEKRVATDGRAKPANICASLLRDQKLYRL